MKRIKYIYIFLFLLNINILFINILLLNKNKSFIFKNNDIFLFNFNLNSFKDISLLINKNKYYLKKKNQNSIQNTSNTKQSIKIFFEDCMGYQINKILSTLQKKYEVKITNNTPDYLFFGTFGCNHLKQNYNNIIKIAFFTENQIPDFNIADYSFGFCHINFLDRYFFIPKYIKK